MAFRPIVYAHCTSTYGCVFIAVALVRMESTLPVSSGRAANVFLSLTFEFPARSESKADIMTIKPIQWIWTIWS